MPMEFAMLADDPAFAPVLREIYAALGESLGPPAKSADESAVTIDGLSEELTYIKALR